MRQKELRNNFRTLQKKTHRKEEIRAIDDVWGRRFIMATGEFHSVTAKCSIEAFRTAIQEAEVYHGIIPQTNIE